MCDAPAGPERPRQARGDHREPSRPDPEAECEGWLGEVENLTVSLTVVHSKVTQLDEAIASTQKAVHLGMPTFAQIAGRANE
jgi:hypothetical protein